MKNPLCILVLTLGLSAVAPMAGAVGDAANGEGQVAVCAGCHGSDGNSPAPNFPKLSGLGEKYLLKQLQDIQSGKRNVVEMTGLLNGKSAQDLADMAAFYSAKTLQLAGAKNAQVQLNSGEKTDALELGERVYRAGNMETAVPACTGCHSPTGLGNSPAGYPRIGGQHAAYLEKQLRDFRAGNRTNDSDAQIMRKVAEHMSDAEISALANYISGLN